MIHGHGLVGRNMSVVRTDKSFLSFQSLKAYASADEIEGAR
jgi:hypothetical protein